WAASSSCAHDNGSSVAAGPPPAAPAAFFEPAFHLLGFPDAFPPPLHPFSVELTVGDCFQDGAAGLGRVRAAAEAALPGELVDVGEFFCRVAREHSGFPQAGVVDDHTLIMGQEEHLPPRR